jgi:hypothetical protein
LTFFSRIFFHNSNFNSKSNKTLESNSCARSSKRCQLESGSQEDEPTICTLQTGYPHNSMFSRFEFMSRVLNNDHIHPISQQIFGRNWLPASEKLHEKNDFHVGWAIQTNLLIVRLIFAWGHALWSTSPHS